MNPWLAIASAITTIFTVGWVTGWWACWYLDGDLREAEAEERRFSGFTADEWAEIEQLANGGGK